MCMCTLPGCLTISSIAAGTTRPLHADYLSSLGRDDMMPVTAAQIGIDEVS